MSYSFISPRDEKELKEEISAPGSFTMSGGTDLLVKIRMGKISPQKIVSTSKISTLHFIDENDDEIVIGSTITHAELLEYKPLREAFPVLFDAIYTIGSPQIRNRGTLVGNVMNASPAGDGLLALYLLDAKIEISNGDAVNIDEFVVSPGRTILPKGEYVKSIHIPKSKWDHHYFEKVGQRNSMTISIVSIGWLIKCGSEAIENLRIAFGSVAPTILRLKDVEKFSKGKKIDEKFVHVVSDMVKERVNPIDDVRGSAQYRKKLCSNLMYRMVEEGIKC